MRVLVTTLLTIPLLLPAGIAVVSVSPTRADDLADRIAASRQRQEELLRSIDRNSDLVEQLRADQDLADLALEGSASRLDGINVDQAAVREDVQAATDALRRVEARQDTLVAELRQLDWTMALLESEMEQGEADLEALRRQLGERLAEAYRTGQTSLLEQVLDSGTFTDVLTGVDAQLRFGEQDVELAKTIESDQAELDSLRRLTAATRYNTDQLRIQTIATEQELALRRERLRAAQDLLARIEAETRRLLQQQRDEYERISTDKEDAAAEIAAHQAAEDRLASEISGLVAEAARRAEAERVRLEQLRLERERAQEARERAEQEARERAEQQARERAQEAGERAAQQRESDQREQPKPEPRPRPAPPPPSRGLVSWPVSGYVTQEFGCTGFSWEPRVGNCAHFHDGLDITGGDGTPIRAAASGVVAFIGYNPYDDPDDPAWIVVMGHAGNLDTWYAHLQPRYAPGVRRGSRVVRGQIIGYMGNTGYSTGVHLHWEVHRGGTPVDPRSQL